MARKDVLAAGGHKAQFAGGLGEEVDFARNLYKGEETETVETVTAPTPTPRRRFTPAGTTILVRRSETKTPQGLIILDETKEKDAPAEGIVLAVGHKATDATEGDEIVFGKYAGALFTLNGEKLLLMDQKDILGWLQNEPGDDYVVPAGRA